MRLAIAVPAPLPLVAVALCATPVSAQLSQTWMEKYGPTADGCTGTLASAFPDGGVVVAGHVDHKVLPNYYGDFLTVRYDAQGNELWARTYDGPLGLDDRPSALVVDKSGNVLVAGPSTGTATSSTERAFVVCKYAPDGAPLWTLRYEGAGLGASLQTGVSMAVDDAGRVYLTGSARLTPPPSWEDVVTLACDAAGHLLWERAWDSANHGNDVGRDIAVTPGGRVVVTGIAGQYVDLPNSLTLAYAADGSLQWSALEPSAFGHRVAAASDGRILVAGTDDTADPGALLVAAYDPAGALQWKTSVPQSAYAYPVSVAAGPAGDLYVAGSVSVGYWANDLAVVRVGPNGQVLWQRDVTGGFKVPGEIEVDAAGNACVAGYSGAWQVNAWKYAAWDYSASGDLLWSAWFAESQGGSDTFSHGYALALGVEPGSLFVTGNSLSACTTVRFDAPPPPRVYCTTRASSLAACTPSIGAGSALASLGAGACDVTCSPVPGGNRIAIALASTGGPLGAPVLGVYGWSCIAAGPGWYRLPPVFGGGTPGVCDGLYELDVGAWLAAHAGDPALAAGGTLDLQVWYRDPPNPGGANLSNALSLDLVP